MGYELRMHVIRFYDGLERALEGGIEIARIDLCKIGDNALAHAIREARAAGAVGGFYADDSNTVITKDRYDDKLPCLTIPAVLAAIESGIAADHDRPYRRYVIARAMLKAIAETFDTKDVYCLFFGH